MQIGLYALHGERSEFVAGVIEALRAQRYEVRLRNADGLIESDREVFVVVGSDANQDAVAACYAARGAEGEPGYAPPIPHVALDPEAGVEVAVDALLGALPTKVAPVRLPDPEPEPEPVKAKGAKAK